MSDPEDKIQENTNPVETCRQENSEQEQQPIEQGVTDASSENGDTSDSPQAKPTAEIDSVETPRREESEQARLETIQPNIGTGHQDGGASDLQIQEDYREEQQPGPAFVDSGEARPASTDSGAAPADRQEARPASVDSGEAREKIIYRDQELSPEDKKQIFHQQRAELLLQANQIRQQKYQAHLSQVTIYLQQHGWVSNHDIQSLLKVARSTAAKYLSLLAQKGEILKVGRTGRSVRYRLKSALN